MWFEHLTELLLWTSIVWPSGDYTFILDEGNISAWCCRMQVVNYRRVIYDWIKNGGKNNIWQGQYLARCILIRSHLVTRQLRSAYTRFRGNKHIFLFWEAVPVNVPVVPPVRLFTFIQLADTLAFFFFLLLFFKINFYYTKQMDRS